MVGSTCGNFSVLLQWTLRHAYSSSGDSWAEGSLATPHREEFAWGDNHTEETLSMTAIHPMWPLQPKHTAPAVLLLISRV